MTYARTLLPLCVPALLLALSGCAKTANTSADIAGVFFADTTIAPSDVPAQPDVPSSSGDALDADVGALDSTEVINTTNISAVLASASTTTVALGETLPLTLQVSRKLGDPGPPLASETLQFQIDGVDSKLGTAAAPAGTKQPAVWLWKGKDPNSFLVVGAHSGSSELTVSVDGVQSNALTIQVVWDGALQGYLSTPKASGSTPLTRIADNVDTVKLDGKTLGAGGLTLTMRLPASAQAGDEFDVENPPKVGGLQVKAALADLGNLSVQLLKGRVMIEQVDKGVLRGSWLGVDASLLPLCGRFAVERDGSFGVDIMDDAQLIESSTASEPEPGVHVSRVTVSDLGDGRALLTYRRIKDVTTAQLVRVVIDAKTGVLTTNLPPIVDKAPTLDANNLPMDSLGWASACRSADQTLVTWEGRAGANPFGQHLPGKIWYRQWKSDDSLGPAVEVSDMDCDGACQPKLVPLPNSRFLFVWSAPDGSAVLGRRLNGNGTFQDGKPLQLAGPGVGLAAATSLQENVAATWQVPGTGARFRMFLDTLASNGPEQDLGVTIAAPPPPSVAALNAPPSFVALFVDSPGSGQKTLKYRRFGLDAIALGTDDSVLASGVDRAVIAGGKPGQFSVISRSWPSKADSPQLHITKVGVQDAGDPGSQLGNAFDLKAFSPYSLLPALVYVASADTYVLAWSGDVKSDEVRVQRFR